MSDATVDLRAAGLGATYRLQLRPGFGFDDAAGAVPYLARLGIETVYLSPVAEAVPGSAHGYDGIDPTYLRDELGGATGYDALVGSCASHGLGICVDHVPNHLAAWPGGGWWRRLLAEGPESEMGEVFDVDWQGRTGGGAGGWGGGARRTVALPVLDRPLGEALAAGMVRLCTRGDQAVLEVGAPEERGVDLPISGGRADPGDDVAEVLAAQHYRLVDWHDAAARNYRRFFDIDGLVGVRVEVPAVFDATHALLVDLASSGRLSAVRVDHVDGLRRPTQYLRRLADATGVPVVVEKILTGDEHLRADWPVLGTTGYEVLDDIGGVLVDAHGYDRLVEAGRAEGDDEVAPLTVETRRLVATESFPAEIARAAERVGAAREDLRELVVHLPRYRTYLDGATSPSADGAATRATGAAEAAECEVWRAAQASAGARDGSAMAPVVDAVLDPRHRSAALGLQQLTGALMAKGVEDTAWFRLAGPLAFCEVGGDPERRRHDALARWHERALGRVASNAGGLVPGTTHDTKRALDVRCRLYALSEMPRAFDEGLGRLRRSLEIPEDGVTLAFETRALAELAIGILPPLGRDAEPAPGDAAWPGEARLAERLGSALVKGAREAKRRSSWRAPDEEYERRLRALAGATFRDGGARLRECFGAVVDEAARLGAVCSLSAVVLRHCVPGIPDCFQGDEAWNLSLVDPDNRRPVDLDSLASCLAASVRGDDGDAAAPSAADLRETWRDGRVKMLVTSKCLHARRGPGGAAFSPSARYQSLAPVGPSGGSVMGFARTSRTAAKSAPASASTSAASWAIPVVTRLPGRLPATGDDLPVGPSYADTILPLPDGAPSHFVDALSGRTVRAADGAVALEDVLSSLPVALLMAGPPPG